MLALTAIISMPSMIILLALNCKPWDSITVFFATLDFVSDLVVGTIYAARSHNMVLEAPDRRFFLLMAVLAFFFTGLQMLLSISGFVIRVGLISESLSMCFIPVHLGLCAWSVVSWSRKAEEGSEQVLRLKFHGHFFDPVIPVAAPLAILLFLQIELFFKLVPFFWDKSCGYIRDKERAGTRKVTLQLIAFATFWMVLLPSQISTALSVAFGKANAEDTLEVGSLAVDLIDNPEDAMSNQFNPQDARSNQDRCHRIGYVFQCVEAVPVTAVQILVLWHARKTCLPVTWIELVSIVSSGLNLFVLFFLRALHGLTYGSFCARMCGCSS
jgi:hypothetical protein